MSHFARDSDHPAPHPAPGRTILRDVYWAPWDGLGCEHARLAAGPEGARADGLVLLRRDGVAIRCRYRLETDSAWRVRKLRLGLVPDDGASHGPQLSLAADGAGHWEMNGAPAPDLEGCTDLDIQVTPLTNSLPIRRLGLIRGESAEIRVAYLPVPELAPRPAAQRYTCVKTLGPDGGRYRYESLAGGFSAELPVDSDGLVTDYPETFRRIWPT